MVSFLLSPRRESPQYHLLLGFDGNSTGVRLRIPSSASVLALVLVLLGAQLSA
jgi:hypothetical protein